MTTRAKLALCVGLFAVAVGVVMVRSFRAGPAVEVRFGRYTEDGNKFTLTLANRTGSDLQCNAPAVFLFADTSDAEAGFTTPDGVLVKAHSELPLKAWLRPHRGVWILDSQERVEVFCFPQDSRPRKFVARLMDHFGRSIANTGFVATVTLPPRPAATSSGPTNQNTP